MKINIRRGWGKHLLKVLAIAFAFMLWFYVLNSESKTETIIMEVDFQLPSSKAISSIVQREVKVKLQGPRAFFRNLQKESTKVFIDLKKQGSKRNDFIYKIENNNIPVPFGMEILDVSPKKLKIKLGKKISKVVPIKGNIVGELENNLKLQKFKLSPHEVEIEGPRSIVNKIDQIQTKPIDVSTLEGESTLKVSLEEVDTRIKLKSKTSAVSFSYEVRPRKANVTLKNIEIFFLSRNQNFETKSSRVALDVLVPGGKEMKIKTSEVRVVAEIPDSVTKKQRIKLKATLPDGVHLLQIHPEYINVTPKKARKKKRRK